MITLEKTGKTVEEALQTALAELGVTREHVDLDVLEEGSKGILLGFGAKHARIKVTLKEEQKEEPEPEPAKEEETLPVQEEQISLSEVIKEGQEFLAEVLGLMGLKCELVVSQQTDHVRIDIKGDNIGILIGKHGHTLDALQYILNIVVNKKTEEKNNFVLDVEGYRAKREQTLRELAKKLAAKVKEEKRSIVLEPMLPYERKIIHTTLQNNPHVNTYSQGGEPIRKVVITPSKK